MVAEDPLLSSNYDVKVYDYPSGIFCLLINPFCSNPSIHTIANGLETEINTKYKNYKQIIIVAHSLGGIVAIDCLTYHLNDLQYIDSSDGRSHLRISGLVLFAVPLEGSQLATRASTAVPWSIPQLSELRKDSPYIYILRGNWYRQHLDQSLKHLYITAGLDNVISVDKIEQLWDKPFATVINKDHVSIVKPKDREELSYKLLQKFAEDTNATAINVKQD